VELSGLETGKPYQISVTAISDFYAGASTFVLVGIRCARPERPETLHILQVAVFDYAPPKIPETLL
jgi:hypothetical protein